MNPFQTCWVSCTNGHLMHKKCMSYISSLFQKHLWHWLGPSVQAGCHMSKHIEYTILPFAHCFKTVMAVYRADLYTAALKSYIWISNVLKNKLDSMMFKIQEAKNVRSGAFRKYLVFFRLLFQSCLHLSVLHFCLLLIFSSLLSNEFVNLNPLWSQIRFECV